MPNLADQLNQMGNRKSVTGILKDMEAARMRNMARQRQSLDSLVMGIQFYLYQVYGLEKARRVKVYMQRNEMLYSDQLCFAIAPQDPMGRTIILTENFRFDVGHELRLGEYRISDEIKAQLNLLLQ